MKQALLRYLGVMALMVVANVLFVWYYSSPLYTEPIGTKLPTLPPLSDVPIGLLMFGVLIGFKYLLYDAIGQAIMGKRKEQRAVSVFYAGYGLALAADLFFLFASLAPQVDAGFAMLGSIFYTPWILVAFLVAILVIVLMNKTKGASPTSRSV